MCVVRSLIIFVLVFNKNYVQKTSAASKAPPPCEELDYGKEGCQGGLFECTDEYPHTCCPWETPMLDGGKCRKSKLGEKCSADFHCESGECNTHKYRKECSYGKPKNQTYDGDCWDDSSCDTELICEFLQKCACKEGFEWKKTACVKTQKKTLNGGCNTHNDCITEPKKLICFNGRCECAEGFVWSEGICQAKEKQTQCNPSEETNECHKNSKQMECDETEKICRCPRTMEFSIAMQACKLRAGQNCSINGTAEHDLCASQHCVSKTGSTIPICACPPINGDKETWSSDPGVCVIDYFSFPCKGSNEHCRPATFNPSRKGLICKANLCQCDQGLTYKRGYCVEANLLFNQSCEPNGVRPTCKAEAETSLTCRDVGGRDFRCVCLEREITVRGERQFVSLYWHGDLGKCGLNPPGEKCNDCQICPETFESKDSRARATGIGTKIDNYDLLIALSAILTLNSLTGN